MIHALCTGPESSGTRLLTRIVSNLNDVKATHRSIPHAKKWWDMPKDITHIVCIVRDPFITKISAMEAGHPKNWSGEEAQFPYRITRAWEVMIDSCRESNLPWIPVTYEGLLARPQFVLDGIAEFLGVEKGWIQEHIKDTRSNL